MLGTKLDRVYWYMGRGGKGERGEGGKGGVGAHWWLRYLDYLTKSNRRKRKGWRKLRLSDCFFFPFFPFVMILRMYLDSDKLLDPDKSLESRVCRKLFLITMQVPTTYDLVIQGSSQNIYLILINQLTQQKKIWKTHLHADPSIGLGLGSKRKDL